MKDLKRMFMSVAEITALASNCVKYKVGAVAVKDNRIVMQGYNGTVAGAKNCSEEFGTLDISLDAIRHAHHHWANAFEVHAEMNIISYAARKGIALEGATIYCTLEPCNNCLKHMVQAGIKEVIFSENYSGVIDLSDRQELLRFVKVWKF